MPRARDAGEKYLRDVLLPQWSSDPTFGHNFWDWENATDTCTVPGFVADYMLGRRQSFPDWKGDVRNVLSMFLCRSSVDPASAGGVYSGAWAVPESSCCCGKSLQASTMHLSPALARYALLADSPWAWEIARRQALLTTYDAQESGVVEDLVDGGAYVTVEWFNSAHPGPLRAALRMLAWQPDVLGANRENHIMRSRVGGLRGALRQRPDRLFHLRCRGPQRGRAAAGISTASSVSAGGQPLPRQEFPFPGRQAEGEGQNGFTVRPLPNGDCLLTIRHDGRRDVVVEGDDPQELIPADRLDYMGTWSMEGDAGTSGAKLYVAAQAGARATCNFEGNQVRLIGQAGPAGGKATSISMA